MKNFPYSEGPPVWFFMVFAIFGLVLIVGLAVDGGNGGRPPTGYHVQRAADVTALSAALCRVRSNKPWTECASVGYDVARHNGYANDLVSNKVEVYTCDMAQARCGDYAGNPDCIQVIITSDHNTFLTDVIGLRQRYRAQAMALAQPLPAKVQLLHSSGGTGLTGTSLVFSVPAWLQFVIQPYGLLLLILIGAIILGLLLLLRRRRVQWRV